MKNNEFPLALIRPSLLKVIKEYNSSLLDKSTISSSDLEKVKRLYFVKVLDNLKDDERSRDEIIDSLLSSDFVSDNINQKIEDNYTLKDKVAIWLSNFFGSWVFITMGIVFVLLWLGSNTLYSKNSIDPYPFALLGLLLTGLSALQAPFILNSQKKQALRDQIKFDEDYQTNIKSELEIRNLHSKIDHYNKEIWHKLEQISNKLNYLDSKRDL